MLSHSLNFFIDIILTNNQIKKIYSKRNEYFSSYYRKNKRNKRVDEYIS